MPAKNAFYAQSGGVTAVINATACGVIETARKFPKKIANVYAGRNGIIGALTEDMIDTSKGKSHRDRRIDAHTRRRFRFSTVQAQRHRGKSRGV